MKELPLKLTMHAREQYAVRSHSHLEVCVRSPCAECDLARTAMLRAAHHRLHDQKIRMCVRAADFVCDYTDIVNGWPREIVVLQHGGMRFYVKVLERENVLVTYMPTTYHLRTEPLRSEIAALLATIG